MSTSSTAWTTLHYQLLRFCQATRLQYLNGQISIRNQNSLQQQHVDRKIADALLKKGTKGAYTSWTQQDRAWVDMVLHLPHEQGGITNNTVSPPRSAVRIDLQVCSFSRHFFPRCSTGVAARQHTRRSIDLGSTPPAHAPAPP